MFYGNVQIILTIRKVFINSLSEILCTDFSFII